MPYMCHTETCRRSRYTFWPSNPKQGVFFRAWLLNRVPNLYDHSKPGCLFTVLFGTLPLVLTYLSFVQEINPSFDVFNIFKVLIWHTVQEFVRVSFENNSFLCFDTLFRWLLSFSSSNLPREFVPPPKNWFENNRKISITKEMFITIDSPEKIPERRKSDSEAGCIFQNFTPKQGNSLKILATGTRNHGVSLPPPRGFHQVVG